MDNSDDDYAETRSSSPALVKSPKARTSQQKRIAAADPFRKLRRKRHRHQKSTYNDQYRELYNADVISAAERVDHDDLFFPKSDSQIGASTWSVEEKSAFFGILPRVGKDNLPALARSIGTKSVAEVRQFLLLLEKGHTGRNTYEAQSERAERAERRILTEDIPAAFEIGADCEEHLAAAGEVLAAEQEVYDAKQEQKRYGQYWLLSPEVAEQIQEEWEDRKSVAQSSVSQAISTAQVDHNSTSGDAPDNLIMDEIPEAELLNIRSFLLLSRSCFMNPYEEIPYPWPHWSELVQCGIADEPSIFRTAFIDFHTLVVSLTRRLVQVAIIQATSRLRAQELRSDRSPNQSVNRKDVLTAIDLLRLERNGHERWRGMARRCGLKVVEGKRARDDTSKKARWVPWEEVEKRLATEHTKIAYWSRPHTVQEMEGGNIPVGTGDTAIQNTAIQDEFDASSRPKKALKEEISIKSQDESEHAVRFPVSADPEPTMVQDSSDEQHNGLAAIDEFDKVSSFAEERRLWQLLRSNQNSGISPPLNNESDVENLETSRSPGTDNRAKNWHDHLEYRPI